MNGSDLKRPSSPRLAPRGRRPPAPTRKPTTPARCALTILNQQRRQPINTALLRRIVRCLLAGLFPSRTGALGLHLVTSRQMTRLNEQFLQHQGATDVITFDYASSQEPGSPLYGEVFVSPEVARAQAPRYRTTWQQELTRHVVHGLLHLAGETDSQVQARKAMKKKEDCWLKRLRRRFPLSQL